MKSIKNGGKSGPVRLRAAFVLHHHLNPTLCGRRERKRKKALSKQQTLKRTWGLCVSILQSLLTYGGLHNKWKTLCGDGPLRLALSFVCISPWQHISEAAVLFVLAVFVSLTFGSTGHDHKQANKGWQMVRLSERGAEGAETRSTLRRKAWRTHCCSF